jgi:hypothetical protein
MIVSRWSFRLCLVPVTALNGCAAAQIGSRVPSKKSSLVPETPGRNADADPNQLRLEQKAYNTEFAT